MDTQQDIDVIKGKERGYVDLRDGTRINIYACTLGGSAMVMKLMRKVVKHFNIKRVSDIAAIEGQLDNLDVLLDIMEDCHGDLIRVAGDVTDKSAAEVAALELDEGITLLLKIFEVNRDFFTKSLGNVLSLSLKNREETPADQTKTDPES